LININNEIKKDKHYYLDINLLIQIKKNIENFFENYNNESSNIKEIINNEFLNIYKNKTDETKQNYKKNKNNIERGGY